MVTYGNLHNNLNISDLTGEYEDRYFVTARGDSRIAMTIARNDQTVLFNRRMRFIIDDPESPTKLAYTLSKPLKLGWSFNNQGCYKFVLQEINTTDNDDLENSIPDYYLHFPKNTSDNPVSDTTGSTQNGEGATEEPVSGDNTNTDNNSSSESDSASPPGKKVWL